MIRIRKHTLRLSIGLLALISVIVTQKAVAARPPESMEICDMQAALDYCMEAPLDRIEGIWEFPEDNTVVLIKRNGTLRRQYDLIIISTPDCRLNPGEKIGIMTQSVDADKLQLSLFGTRRDGLLTDPGNCSAIFNDKEGTIRVEKGKIKIALNVSRFLPKFWRILSLFKISNPASKLPDGLVRIYPAKDGNGFETSSPHYL